MEAPIALVIEDDARNIEMYGILLQIEKYSVSGVLNGSDAMDWLNNHDAPKLILLDVNMPQIDGRQVYETLRNDPKFVQTAIVIVTANSYMANVMSASIHTGDKLLQKPFQMIELQQIVRDIRRQITV